MKTSSSKTLLTAAVAAAVLAAAAAAVFLCRAVYDRKVPNFGRTTELYVTPGTAPEEVLSEILSSGDVRSSKSLVRTMAREGTMKSVRPGHYTIDSGCSSTYVARMLKLGWQSPVNLTLSGTIRTPEVLARKIGAQMLADSASVADFVFSADSLASYEVDPAHLFCIVIPDTYKILWTASVREIFDRLYDGRNAWWTQERRDAARRIGLSPKQVSTLASIVDGESQYVPEQPLIAGVYLNRLARGQKLQADPTVNFCFGYRLRRILNVHLEVDSPYNTYKYAGLPPGPISCPPQSCLEAVLSPDTSAGYLYFCASPELNGRHRFAATYTEHLRNARAYRNAISK